MNLLIPARETSRWKINAVNEGLMELRQKIFNSPIITQLNINSIRNKFQFLEKEVCANLDILLITETKLNESFPSAQFLLNEFSKPYRLDRCSNGGGILLYVRDVILLSLLLNSNKTEIFLLRLLLAKRNGLFVRPAILIKVTSQTISEIWAKV